jgi:hypothetical protein
MPLGQKISVIDTFIYNGESVVPYRMALLSPFVDKFVIVESRETFSGNRKPYYYSDNLVKALPDEVCEKVVVFKIDGSSVESKNLVDGENQKRFSREGGVRRLLKDAALSVGHLGHAIYLFSDADEIPDPEIFSDKKSLYAACDPVIHLEMRVFYYNFKWESISRDARAYLTTDQYLAEIDTEDVRWIEPLCRLPNSGWHLSYFMSSQEVRRKISSFSHSEFDNEFYKNLDRIEASIDNGVDLFARKNFLRKSDGVGLPAGWARFHYETVADQCQGLDTDKIYWHKYVERYIDFFSAGPTPKKILEIGTFRGGSVRFFCRLFPWAEITSCDILPVQDSWPVDDNVTYYQLDQGDERALRKMFDDHGDGFDFIIDDGSHFPRHQILSFALGFEYLREGGVFILEDAHTSLPDHPYMADYSKAGLSGVVEFLRFVEHRLRLIKLGSDVSVAFEGQLLAAGEILRGYVDQMSAIEFVSRSTLPIRCWKCKESRFLYRNARCSCGEGLVGPTDSLSIMIRKGSRDKTL